MLLVSRPFWPPIRKEVSIRSSGDSARRRNGLLGSPHLLLVVQTLVVILENWLALLLAGYILRVCVDDVAG
jgi:hypothetical protein